MLTTFSKEFEKELFLSHFTLANPHEAVYRASSSGKIIRINNAACRMSDYDKDELKGTKMLQLKSALQRSERRV